MRFVSSLAALALLALLATATASGAVAPAPASAPSVAAPSETGSQFADRLGQLKLPTLWLPCYRADGPFECTIVWAPLDYDRPFAGLVGIFLIRLPASDPGRRIGSLFVNPGGPGGSGVDFVRFASGLFSDELRARFDLVGFDPRGINRSTPLRCFGSQEEWGPFFTPFFFPTTPEEEAIWIEADRFLVDACASRGGRIIDHMSTANVARDLDLLRRAVGDAKLTYAGYSYGTYIGATYANMFPQNVRALVVDGVLNPVEWATGTGEEGNTIPFSTRVESDVGSRATLEEFFRLCDAGGPACAFSGDAAERFAELAERLQQEPVEVVFPDGSTGVFDYSALIGFTRGALYDSFSWPDYAQFLAAVEEAAAAATAPVRMSTRLGAMHRRDAPYLLRRGFQERYTNDIEGFPGVACSDSDNPDTYPAWSAAGDAADAAHGYFGRIWTWASSICAEWTGADADRYVGPWTKQTANPVLVVGNLFDPATPYQGAVTLDALLPNSALLTVHAWGHTSIGLSSCADSVVTRYLVDQSTPAPGTVCEADVVPFAG